jgi:diguanylate cyclase (GGDEF)-like protein/putative nucleotidyltransferase with HDIG domain
VERDKTLERWSLNGAVLLGLVVLWATQPFLLFHTVAEFTSIFLASSLYIIGTQSYCFTKNKALLFISIAFLYIGAFDAAHTLAYNGMELIPQQTANIATQLWVAGRLIQIFTLCFIMVVPRLNVSRIGLEILLFSIFAVIVVFIRTGLFPVCSIEGTGPTPFKKGVEYWSVIMASIAFILIDKAGIVNSEIIKKYIRWSLLFFIASELCFTLYKNADGVLDALGHLFKVVSYQFVWTVVLDEGFAKPYGHLFQTVYDRSVHDQLTGLYNRRFYETEIDRYFGNGTRQLALVMADVNGLKLINDAFGHAEGDRIITCMADVLVQKCKSSDIVIRIGGDEFLILMPETSSDEAFAVINEVKTALSRFSTGGISYSASFGFTQKRNSTESREELFNRAESEMYRRKLAESPGVKRRIIGKVLDVINCKSAEEAAHSARVAEYSEAIARKLGLSEETVRLVRTAATLHDIGKIKLSAELLHKTLPLDETEMKEFRHHPEVGYNILVSVNEYSQLALFVLHHHEQWDGTGYPLGLSGEDIPLGARILSVAESYDYMISERNYQGKMTMEMAIEELRRCSGTCFDPRITTVFIKYLLGQA